MVNTPESESNPNSVWVQCPNCKLDVSKLKDSGVCYDCTEELERQEVKRRRQEMFIEACLGSRGLREFTFENYKKTKENQKALSYCLDFDIKKDSVYLHGTCGTGKTHLAGAIWRKAVMGGLQTEFIKHTELSRLFRMRETEEENALLDKFTNYKVLVIDDLGTGRSTEFANQVLYEILDARINNDKHGLIITSNMPLEKFAEKVGDDRLPSRIAGLCKVIEIGGDDFRLKKAQQNSSK